MVRTHLTFLCLVVLALLALVRGRQGFPCMPLLSGHAGRAMDGRRAWATRSAIRSEALLALRGGGGRVRSVTTKAELDSILAEAGSKTLVILDFSAVWCGPCKMIAPIYEELANEYTDVIFLKVDVDENPEVTEMFQVMSMPTFLLLKNKQSVERWSGASVEKLRAALANHS
jgi:thioredoxin